ncbi:MAG: phosphotransferase system HPr (HPr) family protein [Firmicutes bacterium]|nr:phosphotransferase system HPr (HPr) family protein [Bacillota bacterium]
MKQTEVTLLNSSGLHARPAAQLVKAANQFQGTTIKLSKEDRQIDAKSVLGVMTLGATQGTVLTVWAEGADEDKAVQTLADLIASGLGEGENL